MTAIVMAVHRLPVVQSPPGESTHARPRDRDECRPCPVCQGWRDGELRTAPSHDVTLPCGHTTEQALFHSRPCVFVGCENNTFLDVNAHGEIRYNRYGVEPDECEDSCAQDVADEVGARGASNERIARAMGITRQGAGVLVERAIRKMRRARRKKRLR